MEEDEGLTVFSGKVRQKSSRNKSRPTPYSRINKRIPVEREGSSKDEEGLLGKVTNLIVPSWISNWWNPEKTEIDESSNDSEISTSGERIKLNGELVSYDHENFYQQTLNTKRKPEEEPVKTDSVTLQNLLSSQNLPVLQSNTPSCSKSEKEFSTAPPLQTPKPKVADLQENAEESTRSSSFYESYRSRQKSSCSSKPAFKVSAFMSPMNQSANVSFNTSALNASSFDFSMQRSPFYTGGTTFGGSSSFRESASKRIKLSPVSNRARTTRTQMKAKPLNSSKKNVVTSQTAKRILSTLGKMSSPVKDSRKIPPSIFDNPSFSEMVRKKSKRVSEKDVTAPPTTSLATNKPSDLISSMKNKTDSIKRFNEKANVESPAFSFSTETIKTIIPIAEQPSKEELPPKDKKLDSNTNSSKSSFKMKREKTNISHFSSNMNKEDVVNTMPEITAVSLPLPITTLPKFNFPMKPIASKPAARSIFSSPMNITPIPKSDPKKRDKGTTIQNQKPSKAGNFIFTTPDILQPSKSSLSTPLKKGFAFSSPVNLTKEQDSKVSENSESKLPQKMFSLKEKIKQPEPTDPQGPTIKPLNNIKKLPTNLWSCPICWIDNKPEDKNCAACTGPKPGDKSETRTIQSMKILTKLPKVDEGTWSCTTCFIDNKKDVTKCLACSALKPGDKPIAMSQGSSALKLPKVTPGSWECPVCMISNKPEADNCAACAEPKPGNKNTAAETISGKSDLFKFGENNNDTWSCPTCMIDNKNDLTECAACSELKPGATVAEKSGGVTSSSSFNFGASGSSGFKFGSGNNGFKFGSASNSSELKFGTDNKSNEFKFGTDSKSSGFKFGTDSKSSELKVGVDSKYSEFKFGSNTTKSEFAFGNKSSESNGSNFGADAKSSGFTFGTDNKSSEFTFGGDNSSGFKFGTDKSQVETTESKSDSIPKPNIDTSKPIDFKFGSGGTGGFTFGSSNKTDSSTSSFGKPAEVKNKLSNEKDMKFSFGSTTNSTKIDKPTPDVIPSAIAESEKEIKPPVFGANQGFSFGEKSTEASVTAPKPFEFKPQTNTIDAKKPFPSIADAARAGFLAPSVNFQAGQLTTEPKTDMFSSSTSGFAFDQASNASAPMFPVKPNTEPPNFTFGSVPKASTETEAPNFNFAAGTKTEPPNPTSSKPNFNFGTTSQTNIFGNSSTITSVFGSDAPPKPAASFNFGSSSTLPTFETKSLGFNLSSSNAVATNNQQANPSTDTGFSFSTVTPSFNFGATAKPSFEIENKPNNLFAAGSVTGGSMFNQQNSFGAPTGGNLFNVGQSNTERGRRPIKRAFRRKK